MQTSLLAMKKGAVIGSYFALLNTEKLLTAKWSYMKQSLKIFIFFFFTFHWTQLSYMNTRSTKGSVLHKTKHYMNDKVHFTWLTVNYLWVGFQNFRGKTSIMKFNIHSWKEKIEFVKTIFAKTFIIFKLFSFYNNQLAMTLTVLILFSLFVLQYCGE